MAYQNAPTIFFRVQDEDSRDQYRDSKGIYATAQSNSMLFDIKKHYYDIRDEVVKHLNWDNRDPTCLISTYANESVAQDQAQRRIDNGKEEVVILVIDTSQYLGGAQYRDLRKLVEKIGLSIPKKAGNNSEYEWVFLDHIPDYMIVDTIWLR